ncbi:hypothetical protein ED208_11485 [Stagnimonas aquatica]|uniref:Uncharacterized protein n=1 Tax=Stagnimonas aquatica TaxID=2689987 RepID=A0A3N0V8I4_9GAMM|nr:hypothetical protein [Stagnimonas aquatica]ROH89029.1 hypothetical protein ED208_11485 [Stagnimonas aquatica]
MRVRARFLLLAALPLLLAWGSDPSTQARREVRNFILETLRKQEGATWERVGQYLAWSYEFDRSGCELRVSRRADLSDQFQQSIPLAEAQPVGGEGSELLFQCRGQRPCIEYRVANRQRSDTGLQPRGRLLVMDPDDLRPLQNAFAELHQLCRDPYAPQWRAPPESAERFVKPE